MQSFSLNIVATWDWAPPPCPQSSILLSQPGYRQDNLLWFIYTPPLLVNQQKIIMPAISACSMFEERSLVVGWTGWEGARNVWKSSLTQLRNQWEFSNTDILEILSLHWCGVLCSEEIWILSTSCFPRTHANFSRQNLQLKIKQDVLLPA